MIEKINGPHLSSTVRSSSGSLRQDGIGGTAYKEAGPVSVVRGFCLAGESFLLKVKRIFGYKKV